MNTTKVGIFTLIVLIVLAGMITWKSNLMLIARGMEMVGTFTNIEGLTVGSEVRYRGFSIGKINKIDPGPKDIIVFATIKRDVKIPSDSTLRVGFDGIVGAKYLEIKPGTSETMYVGGKVLQGISTSGIVDFVDIGAQNLMETKRILAVIRAIIEDPMLQAAFKNAVYTADKATINVDNLVEEMRQTNAGIMKITNDPTFQESVKGTVKETNKTLASANSFFESFGKLTVKPSADIQYGSVANIIRANLDVMQGTAATGYLRLGVGEGPNNRNIGLLDLELSKNIQDNVGLRLGMINTYIGGGLDFYMNPLLVLSGDMYDFNNPKPKAPKIRTTASYDLYPFLALMLQADDLINPERNYLIGVTVKGAK